MMRLGSVREVKPQLVANSALPSPTPVDSEPGLDSGRRDGDFDRFKVMAVTIAALLVASVVVLTCLFAAVFGQGSSEDRTWAKTVVIGTLAGSLGFLAGRQSRGLAASNPR